MTPSHRRPRRRPPIAQPSLGGAPKADSQSSRRTVHSRCSSFGSEGHHSPFPERMQHRTWLQKVPICQRSHGRVGPNRQRSLFFCLHHAASLPDRAGRLGGNKSELTGRINYTSEQRHHCSDPDRRALRQPLGPASTAVRCELRLREAVSDRAVPNGWGCEVAVPRRT